MLVLGFAAIAIATVLLCILWLKLHPFLALVIGSLVCFALQPLAANANRSVDSVVQTTPSESTTADDANRKKEIYVPITKQLAAALGDTFGKVGVPILMAAIVGVCLLESGAANRIVEAIQFIFGDQRTLPALSVSSFILAIPVYFDTVFYLLLPLAKAFTIRSGGSYLLSFMAIIIGATMAHSLVPPTPGPLFVSSQLDVPIGTMMIVGGIVGAIAAGAGFAYALWCNDWLHIEMPQIAEDETADQIPSPRKLSLAFALLPLVVPLLMITGSEVSQWLASGWLEEHLKAAHVIETIGDASFALVIAAMLAIIQLRTRCANSQATKFVTAAIRDGGMILLLTCGGGALGAALKGLGIADAIAATFPAVLSPFGILWLSFLLTICIRAAQGSATVAMLTTVGIVSPLIEPIELPFNSVYVAVAIGCGSKPLAWMNDSGFWQISAMTGMSTQQTLQTFSAALTIMGCVGFGVTLLGAFLLPLS